MDRNVVDLEAQSLGDKLASGLRVLGRRPDLQLSVLELSRRVLRLQWRVGEKRIGVGRLHGLGGALEGGLDIAILAEICLRGSRVQLDSTRVKPGCALLDR